MVLVFEPDDFVVEPTAWTGVVPRFIVARTATSVSSSVFNKACLSRGEAVVAVDGVVVVVMGVWSSFAGSAVCLDFSMDVKVC